MEKKSGQFGEYYRCVNYPECDIIYNIIYKQYSTQEERDARKKAHKHFDAIWKDGWMSRRNAYRLLSGIMRVKKEYAHIGLCNKAQCEEIIRVCDRKIKRMERKYGVKEKAQV